MIGRLLSTVLQGRNIFRNYVQFWGGASLKFNMEPENGRKRRSLFGKHHLEGPCIVWISHCHPVAVANEGLEGIPKNIRMVLTVTGWGLDPLYSKNWSLKSASVLYGIHRSIESIFSIHFRTNTGHFLEHKVFHPYILGFFCPWTHSENSLKHPAQLTFSRQAWRLKRWSRYLQDSTMVRDGCNKQSK